MKKETKIYTKDKLVSNYPFLTLREIRITINEIIAEKRGIPYDIAKYKKLLRPKEIEEFKKRYDL